MFALKMDWDKEIDLSLKQQTPIWLSHGTMDPMIDIETAKLSYEFLKQKGIKFDFTQ